MELKKLEARRDELNGFQNEINERVKKVFEINKQLNEEYVKLVDQFKINAGAISELNRQIEESIEVKPEVKVEDKKSKK